MAERVRPFSLKLKIELLNKEDINAILKNIAHLDPKSTVDKSGKTMQLDFPATTAFAITLDDFVYLLLEATGRRVYGSVEDGFINLKFSDEYLTPVALKNVQKRLDDVRTEQKAQEKSEKTKKN